MPFFEFDNLKIYYNTYSDGEPLLLLHGNSVSSKMFTSDIKYFSQFYKVIVMDYPGLGQSDRISYFRDDYWYYNSFCVLELLNLLDIKKTNIIGTSGGALTALNLAVHSDSRINKLIADSFMGFGMNEEEAMTVAKRRRNAKSQVLASAFWKTMNGDDWSDVVDQDIDLMERVGKKNLLTIHGDLSSINCKVLCVAAITDELIPHTEIKVQAVADVIKNSTLKIYDYGKHPFMITQKEEFRRLALDFLNSK